MHQIKNVLCPIDFSAGAASALARACDLARRYGAGLHVLHVATQAETDPYGPLLHKAEAQGGPQHLDDLIGGMLEDALAPHDLAGLRVVTAWRRSYLAIAPVVIAYAEETGVDLIVMGTHGRRGYARLLLGSVAEEVLHDAPCDVLTVRESPAGRPTLIRRVLAPTDFSPFSTEALRRAWSLAADFGARLDVLHVIEPLPFPASFARLGALAALVPDLKTELRARMAEQLALACEPTDPDVPVALHLEEGSPAAAIADFAARHEADFLVMATRGLTGLDRYMLGNVTARVARLSACPVFTIRTPGTPEQASTAEAASTEAEA